MKGWRRREAWSRLSNNECLVGVDGIGVLGLDLVLDEPSRGPIRDVVATTETPEFAGVKNGEQTTVAKPDAGTGVSLGGEIAVLLGVVVDKALLRPDAVLVAQEDIEVGDATKGEVGGTADLADDVDGAVVLIEVSGIGDILLRNEIAETEQPVGGELGSVLDGSVGVEDCVQLMRKPSRSWRLL